MKWSLALILCHLSVLVTALCQDVTERPWTVEFGVSKHRTYKNLTGINFRFISPKFQVTSEEYHWTEEEEKHPEKFQKIRFMIELLYVPAFNACDGACKNFVRINTPGIRIQNMLASKIHKDTLPIYYVSNTTQLKEYGVSANIQYRVLQYKRASAQLTGGLKFFFLTSPDYGLVNHKKVWYWNVGLVSQLDLDLFSPFVDIGIDRIYTIGTEVDFNARSRIGKKRYKLHLRKKTAG